MNTILFHFFVESKNKNKITQTHRCRKQIGGCQMRKMGLGYMSEVKVTQSHSTLCDPMKYTSGTRHMAPLQGQRTHPLTTHRGEVGGVLPTCSGSRHGGHCALGRGSGWGSGTPMGGSWWKDLTECGPLEKRMANHFSILALRTP